MAARGAVAMVVQACHQAAQVHGSGTGREVGAACGPGAPGRTSSKQSGQARAAGASPAGAGASGVRSPKENSGEGLSGTVKGEAGRKGGESARRDMLQPLLCRVCKGRYK